MSNSAVLSNDPKPPADGGPGRSQTESTAAAQAIDREIRGVLASLRRRIRAYVSFQALFAAIVALGVSFWVALALDYLPVSGGGVELSRPVRIALAVLAGAATVACLWRWGGSRLGVPLPDDQLALLLERRYPELSETLMTAVELAPDATTGRHGAAMFGRVQRSAVEQLKSLSLAEVFDPKPLGRTFLLAAVLVGSIVWLAAARRDTFDLAIDRLLFFSTKTWPRMASIEVVGIDVRRGEEETVEPIEFETDSLSAPRGADVSLKVVADANKRLPDECVVWWRTEDGRRGTAPMKRLGAPRAGKQLYVAAGVPFRKLAATLAFHVIGLDARTEERRIRAVESPVVTRATMDIGLPSYMVDSEAYQTRSREDVVLQTAGNAAPIGSALTLKFVSSKPLRAATVRDVEANVDLPATIAADGLTAETLLPRFERNLALAVSLRDADGVSGLQPYRTFVAAVPDAPPKVELELVGIGPLVTPVVRVPTKVKARDDYGLATASVEVVRGDGSIMTHPVPAEAFARTKSPVEIAGEKALDFREIGQADETSRLMVGQKVSLLATARDHRDLAGGANQGASDRRELSIVTPQALLASLEGRELGFRRRFETIVEELTDMRDSLIRVRVSLEARPANTDEKPAEKKPGAEPGDEELTPERRAQRDADRRRLSVERAVQQTEKSSQEVGGIGLGFEILYQEMVNNRLETQDRESRLREQIAGPLRRIGAERFPEVKTALAETLAKIDTAPDNQAAVAMAVERTDALLKDLDAVLQKMLDLETYNEVLALVRGLIDDQRDVADKTKRLRDESDAEFLER